MRKLLINYLVLHYYMRIAGKTVYFLRAANILFPATVGVALIVTGNPYTWGLVWYDYIALGLLFFLYWLGLGNFGFTYFGMYPAKYEELEDKTQRLDFLTAVDMLQAYNPWLGEGVYGTLPPVQREELKFLLDWQVRRMNRNWFGLKYLLPLVLTIIGVTIYALYWSRWSI